MRPVGAPDAAVGAILQHCLDEGAHVVEVWWAGVAEADEAGDFGPAVVALGEQAPDHLEAGLVDALAAARAAEVVEDERHGAAAQARLEVDPVRALGDIDLDMPAERRDLARDVFEHGGGRAVGETGHSGRRAENPRLQKSKKRFLYFRIKKLH